MDALIYSRSEQELLRLSQPINIRNETSYSHGNFSFSFHYKPRSDQRLQHIIIDNPFPSKGLTNGASPTLIADILVEMN